MIWKSFRFHSLTIQKNINFANDSITENIDMRLKKTIIFVVNPKSGTEGKEAIIKKIEDAQRKETVDAFRVGDTVRVSAKIKEGNRERIQVFEGVVLKRQNGGIRETFTVRKLSNGVGVEKTWPLHSPTIEKIEVVRRGKVRRAKLNYLRNRVGKSAKVKEVIR